MPFRSRAVVSVADGPGHDGQAPEKSGEVGGGHGQILDVPGQELRLRLLEVQKVRKGMLLLRAQTVVARMRVRALRHDSACDPGSDGAHARDDRGIERLDAE